MATHQDWWENNGGNAGAIKWLKSLKQGDKFLHPNAVTHLNMADPTGKNFETVTIESIHDGGAESSEDPYLVFSFPDLDSCFNKRLPLKYAFAVRPINTINNNNDETGKNEDSNYLPDADALDQNEDEKSMFSQSTESSDTVKQENIIPFPPKNDSIQNKKDVVSFEFTKTKKRKLNPGNNPHSLLSDSPFCESTPPKAEKSLQSILHPTKDLSKINNKRTYARNRRTKIISPKKEECKQQTPSKKLSRYFVDDDDEENKRPLTRHHRQNLMRQQRISNANDYDSNSSLPFWMKDNVTLCDGPVGLSNMGNTCFMNSTLQSLIHTEKLRHFFLNNATNKWYSEQLNRSNPIGYGGDIALNFSRLVYTQCAKSRSKYYESVTPTMIHRNLSGVLRQFADYRQHDAQEFMTNFLDALHEDLNRIKKKKYMEIPDFVPEKEREFLHTRWHQIYLQRNHSICTDLFAGLLKSTVTCPCCSYTAITFDPFMHLLVPIKAPRSMERAFASPQKTSYSYARNSNNYNGRFEATPLTATDTEQESSSISLSSSEDSQINNLRIFLLPKDVKQAGQAMDIKIDKDILDNNDWNRLHALIYDTIVGEEEERSEHEKRKIHRTQMINSPYYKTDDHYLYYGKEHIAEVETANDKIKMMPRSIKDDLICDFPIYRLFELYQEDKILSLKCIDSSNYNEDICSYMNGHKRMIVQQLPEQWTDATKRRDPENEQKIECFVVFKKPSYDERTDDTDCDMIDRLEVGSKPKEKTDDDDDLYEPFSYPRFDFKSNQLIAAMNDDMLHKYLAKIVKDFVSSIAGNEYSEDDYKNGIEIRYNRNKNERFRLNKISKWTKVETESSNTNSDNNNNDERKQAIKTMVIVFNHQMHQFYTEHQRKCEERIEKYKQKKQRELDEKANKNSKKRTFHAMNGGSSAHDKHSQINHNKRRRVTNQINGYHRESNGNSHNNSNHNVDIDDGVRDSSLPADFQPTHKLAADIKQCFGMFLSREQLGRDNKWFCKRCKDHVQGKKKLDLWWLPSHLIIAIKRFDNHGYRKYSDFVDYPVTDLDLSDIIKGKDSLDIFYDEHNKEDLTQIGNKKRKNEKFIYDLYAVVNHSGSLNFGHYTSTIKFGKKWYNISDSSVSEARNPINASAYILCYKRKQ